MANKIPDTVLNKIKKLFALASDKSTTSHEAAVASQMAQELLKKNGLDLSSFLSITASELDVVEKDLIDPRGARAFGNWKRVLLAKLSALFGVHAFRTKQGLRVIGRRENTERAVHYFEYLVQQVESRSSDGWHRRRGVLLNDHLGKFLLDSKRYGVVWKNNFHFGAVLILDERLRKFFGEPEPQDQEYEKPNPKYRTSDETPDEDEQDDELPNDGEDSELDHPDDGDSGSTALSVIETNDTRTEVQRYIEKTYKTESPPEITMTLDRDGFAQGRLAGRAIDLQLALYVGIERLRLGKAYATNS